MSLPRNISARRESIAKLTRPAMMASPLGMSPMGSYPHSVVGLYSANSAFLKHEDDLMGGNSELHSKASSMSPRSNSIGPEATVDQDPALDQKLIEQTKKYLKTDEEASLAVEGADITRDIYKFRMDKKQVKRSKSFSLVDSAAAHRRGSNASSLNVPGGFRRQFVLEHSKKIKPNLITRNFVEFLSIYGHFAGENLEDDEDVACHYTLSDGADEEIPLLPKGNQVNPHGTATNSKAFFLLVKAFVGTGVLFLPKAFSNGGLLFSAITLFGFGMLSYWCYLILVYSKIAVKVSSFGEIGRICYGNWLQRLIIFSIIISQVGFVAAYIVFTAENLRAFVANVSSYSLKDLDVFWFIVLETVVIVPLTLIRDITKLSLLAVLANTFIMMGLVTIVCFTIKEYISNNFVAGEGIHYFFNKSEFSLFIGVAIFAFEGIGLIIPIQESMIYPNDFPKVLFMVIMTISSIFVFIGSLGYLTFGKNIQTVILLNLPQKSPFVIMIQILYAFAILLSTPIQIFPAVRLIELKLFKSYQTGKSSIAVKWKKNLSRSLFVLATSVIALFGGKNLDKFVSFVGCFACIPLVYMYPPMLHLKSCCSYTGAYKNNKMKFWLGALDYFLIIIGATALVYTTYDILLH